MDFSELPILESGNWEICSKPEPHYYLEIVWKSMRKRTGQFERDFPISQFPNSKIDRAGS